MTTVDFDPDALIDDPYSTYARLRATGRALRDQRTQLWLVPGHADVDRLLRDRRLGRVFAPYEPRDRLAAWNLLNEHSLLEMEPPDHTRLRRLVARPFTPRHIAALRPRIVALADGLLDQLDPAGFDLMTGFAEHLPVEVIAELLGVPPGLRAPLRPWSNRIVALYELAHDEAAVAAAVAAATDLTAMLDELIAWRRRDPGDDLFSALVAMDADGEPALSRDELVATAALLLNAGHEASVNVLGNGVVALLADPAVLERLRATPELITTAVDELIRFDSPLSLFQRTAFAPVGIGDVVVQPGERVGLLLASANRDPAAFADPETLDPARSPNPHVGFGAGIHYCLGAPLARLEIAVALQRLLARMPGLQLGEAPQRRRSFQFRGHRRVWLRAAAT